MKIKFLAAAAAFALASGAHAQTAGTTPEFTAESFRSHVAFLADDRLEGRDAGSPGYELGALYVATQFEGLGLKPGGDGGWYQQVPFVQYKMGDGAGRVTIGGRSFANRAEVLIAPSPVAGAQAVEAPVVFVGYGIDSPAAGIEDYKGLDVKGKIVAMFGGSPKDLPSDVAAHLNSDKRRMAAARGAVGIIMLRSAEEATRRPWARMTASAGEPALTWLGKDLQPYGAAPGIRARASLDTPAAEALFAGSKRSFAQVQAELSTPNARPKGFALKQIARIEQESTVTRTTSPNVLGIIPGSDPALANEYVLLMAHLDGLGVHDAEGGDKVHNGAMDNATGVATLLEVAKAMQLPGNRPKRSILLAAVTAEEDGLLGAQYLARNPVVGGGKVVGVVNLDMPVLLYDFQDVIAFGAEHSTMGAIVERAAGKMGVKLSGDPLPQEGLFTRSDHYRFVQEGIPAVFLMTGFANGGEEKFTGFLSTNYHKPTDDLKLPFDWKAGAKFAQINYLIASEIANAAEAPRWYSDSFFGKTVAPNAPKATR
ncbi:MAG TPA: M28 family metallopeptidase [Allosphingosinicella sp.]|jgi:Zn-dependent M28 family amino/carboxypeptidase